MNKRFPEILAIIFTIFSLSLIALAEPARADAYRWYTNEGEALIIKKNPYYDVSIDMTDEDYAYLREMVYWEAARCGCDIDVCEACVQVAFNRLLSGNYGASMKAVLTQKGQFTTKRCFFTETISKEHSELIDDAISEVTRGVEVIPEDYEYFATFRQRYAKDHIFIGKGKRGMYFGRPK